MTGLVFRRTVQQFARCGVVARPMAVRCYTEGATGGTRSTGGGDAFTKREKAQEDYYVKKREAEKIAALREALKKQREHLDSIEEHLNDLEKKE